MTFTQHGWTWSNFPGAPGYTIFRFRGQLGDTQINTALAQTKTFLEAIKAYIGMSIVLTPDSSVKFINEADGSISGVQSATSLPAVVTSGGASPYAGVSGFCFVWRTGVSTGRRLVMGRTFIVPATSTVFANTGLMVNATRIALVAAALAFVGTPVAGSDGHPIVWHRPKAGVPGSQADILSVSINSLGAELTTRRS